LNCGLPQSLTDGSLRSEPEKHPVEISSMRTLVTRSGSVRKLMRGPKERVRGAVSGCRAQALAAGISMGD